MNVKFAALVYIGILLLNAGIAVLLYVNLRIGIMFLNHYTGLKVSLDELFVSTIVVIILIILNRIGYNYYKFPITWDK